MNNRQKEDKLMDSLSDPTENHSEAISNLINKTLRSKNKVYLATDWHLWKRKAKGKPECTRCKNFEEIFKNVNGTVTPDDLLIYMGDFVDGEFKDKEALKDVLLSIPCKKVMVRGNNDLFGPSFYKSCGFEYCVQSFIWSDILFCHIPAKNDLQMNIHGHIHSNQYPPVYWIDYTNQIDVAWCGGREKPVELKKVIDTQKEFSKHIKVDHTHMQEGYGPATYYGMFVSVMEAQGYIPDPFDDDAYDRLIEYHREIAGS
jgi:calcineurin-like phosphoesterase family protein